LWKESSGGAEKRLLLTFAVDVQRALRLFTDVGDANAGGFSWTLAILPILILVDLAAGQKPPWRLCDWPRILARLAQ